MISLYIGSFFVSGNSNFENQKFNLELAKTHFLQYCIGSLILASAMSLMFGFGSYFLLQKLGPNKNKF
jgi:hypothetical protein